MFKWLLLFLALTSPAAAQNVTCATRPAGDNSNACASTSFVGTAITNIPSIIQGTPTANNLAIWYDSTHITDTATASGALTFLGTPTSANLRALVTDETGSGGSLVFATGPTLTSPIINTPTINTPTITALQLLGTSTGYTTLATTNTSATNYTATFPTENMTVGFRNIPPNSQTGAYVLVASDNGKYISITTGGVTVNASIFSAGDVVSIYNNSASTQSITAGTNVTFRLVGTNTTGSPRTVSVYGIATLLCVTGGANPVFVVSGSVL